MNNIAFPLTTNHPPTHPKNNENKNGSIVSECENIQISIVYHHPKK